MNLGEQIILGNLIKFWFMVAYRIATLACLFTIAVKL